MNESGITPIGDTEVSNLMESNLKNQQREWRNLSIELLNDIFEPLTYQERIALLYKYFDEDEVLYTSSFGTKSVFLLYWISKIRPTQTVHFIDTTYHFKETISYKEQLTNLLGLQIVDVLIWTLLIATFSLIIKIIGFHRIYFRATWQVCND